METMKIAAKDVQAGDELKTSEGGFIAVGGAVPLSNDKVGLLTPQGMLGVGADDIVTVRRP